MKRPASSIRRRRSSLCSSSGHFELTRPSATVLRLGPFLETYTRVSVPQLSLLLLGLGWPRQSASLPPSCPTRRLQKNFSTNTRSRQLPVSLRTLAATSIAVQI